jgi:hypothetical protein
MQSNPLKIIFYCLALSFIFLSCKESERKEVNSLLKEWIGKKLIFPSNQFASIMGDSTVLFSDYISDNSHWKIVFYADSLGCVSCDLNLLEWMDFMEKAKELTNQRVDFFFYFAPEKKKDIISALKLEGFHYPVFIDTQKDFDRINQLPDNQKFRTFLLNAENEIVLIGNPTQGIEMEKLYYRVLNQ